MNWTKNPAAVQQSKELFVEKPHGPDFQMAPSLLTERRGSLRCAADRRPWRM
jgi:hypothetical protein